MVTSIVTSMVSGGLVGPGRTGHLRFGLRVTLRFGLSIGLSIVLSIVLIIVGKY